MFSVLPKSAQKWLKSLLGEGFQFFQSKTDRPRQAGKQNRHENAIGLYGIAQQQVASIFQVIPTSAPKWLESLLGKGSSLFQVKTDRPRLPDEIVKEFDEAAKRRGYTRQEAMILIMKKWIDE